MSDNFPLEQVARTIGCDSVEFLESIQTLWSGYGQIARVRLHGGKHRDGETVVVKHVCPPSAPDHKYGWANDLSHQRKLKSYEIERTFYSKFAARCRPSCPVPETIASWINKNAKDELLSLWIAMEDMDASGFSIRRSAVNESQLDACLQWLANFHATFLVDTKVHSTPACEGLWQTGTYWHLETRPDELNAMPAGPLKQAAAAIDSRLSQARFQTIVHGDAKLANFCFSANDQVAAVDFQYVGGGCGMKDIAYFVSSCFSDRECEKRERELLDRYFAHLKNAVADSSISRSSFSFADMETEWRSLYAFAWADFYRFLAGWSPGHWKMHGYSEQMTGRALAEIPADDQ